MTVPSFDYRDIASQKLYQRNQNFKQEWLLPESQLPDQDVKDVTTWITKAGVLAPLELEITEATASEILSAIRTRKWTSVEVTTAFCHRASIAQQLTNCLSEVFFDEAIQQARELDEYQETHNATIGPLHGLPVSLKDNLNVKGQATTIGIVDFSFKPEKYTEDSVIVLLLRNLGAVFYVKTNVPVAMMMPETNNHIYGNTLNPMNRLLSAGGSSGGEAALIKLKGSVLGVGSDIGGSIRIPASFQNLYGLRPTFGRFPTFGTRSGLPGLESVNSVGGPIANDLDALEVYCKAILGTNPWDHDPKVVEIPWREVELPEKLNIAVCIDDGYVRPTPPIRRGMKIVIDALKANGHDVIEWNPEEHLRLSEIITEFFISDGGVHLKKDLSNTLEPFFPYMKMYGTTPELKVSQLWKLQAERSRLIKKYLDRWLATSLETKNGKPIDAIILPATPFAGNPNGKFHNYVGYTSPFNALDFAAGTFPVTTADRDLDPRDPISTDYCETDTNIWQDYDPEETHGGAVALQLVGRRFQEEKVLKMLKVVSELIV